MCQTSVDKPSKKNDLLANFRSAYVLIDSLATQVAPIYGEHKKACVMKGETFIRFQDMDDFFDALMDILAVISSQLYYQSRDPETVKITRERLMEHYLSIKPFTPNNILTEYER